jgi:hypothetical protein
MTIQDSWTAVIFLLAMMLWIYAGELIGRWISIE